MEIGLIIGVIVFYFYTVTCGFLAVRIAADKGRRRLWGWLGVLLGILGVGIVCFLPNAKGIKGETNPIRGYLRKLSGISPVAVWIVLIGIIVVVGGALLGTRLMDYIQNRSHEKELVSEQQELLAPSVVEGEISKIYCGDDAQFAITKEGDLYGWGQVEMEPLDDSGILYQDVKKICTVGDTIYLLATDGTLYAKGENANALIPGQKEKTVKTFVKIDTKVKDMALSRTVGAYIKESGNLYLCGVNTYGQLGLDAERVDHTDHCLAKKVAQVVVTNRSLYYRLENGTVYALGNNAYGQFGLGHKDSSGVPVEIATDCKTVAAGVDFTVLLKKDGKVLTAGNNALGQLGRKTAEMQAEELKKIETVSEDEQEKFVSALKFGAVELEEEVDKIAAANHTCYALSGETAYGWGHNDRGQVGGKDLRVTAPAIVHRTAADLAAGDEAVVIITQGGKLMGSGSGRLEEMAKVKEEKE